ncbi:AAA family ATPase [Paenibacillus typhae]|uniref:AAA domain-containing protein n=1 Tax=Paenibacillus typhae TaxID=1174501 RepID=A0A1G8FBR6_9BACL|nr:AAA family ATPase [Paenibacillus typhae]SDH79522.1 AAA domain-containing protein [Paenibacillus typhae]
MEYLNPEKIITDISAFIDVHNHTFFFIIAPTKKGKTSVLKEYVMEQDSTCYMTLTANAARYQKLISLTILCALGDNVGNRYCLEDNLKHIKVLMKNEGISSIIIDDIQNLIGSDQRNWFFKLLHNLANEADVKFILSGTDIPELEGYLSSNTTIKKYAI